MRGLTACLVIACLALTNGAPPKKVTQDGSPLKKANTFGYEFKNKLSDKSFEGSGDELTTIYARSIIDGKIIYKCDVDANYLRNTSLLNDLDSHLIYSGKDKIVTVNLKNCSVKTTSLDIDVNAIKEIVLHDDKYYVIFYDVSCKEFYCKAIYDIDGKVVKAASPLLGINTASDIKVKISEMGFLLNEFRLDAQIKLYFYLYNDLDNPKLLYSVPHGSWYGLSTEENKLGFCAYDDGKTVANAGKKVICQQYDLEGKIKTMETEIPIAKENHVEFLKTFNVGKGLFAMMDEWEVKNDGPAKHTFFMYIDENGKQGKHIDIDTTCEDNKFDQVFYKNSVGDYCITYVCYDSPPNAKCFKESELMAGDV